MLVPRNAAGSPHVGHGLDVRLDRRLEPIDPAALLAAAHRGVERRLVADRSDLLVGVEPLFQLVVEVLDRPFADSADPRSHRVQGPDELTLIAGEGRLDEYDVHRDLLSVSGWRRASDRA